MWKDVVGYEGFYQVSIEGKIKSLSRLKQMGKNGFYVSKEFLLKTSIDRGGYEKIVILRDGKPKYTTVHRVVATAFLPNEYNLPHVNHINSIKTDNRIENLEWVSKRENMYHKIKTKGTKSNIVGVYMDNRYKFWRAYIYDSEKRRTIHIGRFKTKEEAEQARIAVSNKMGIQNKYL